MSVKPTVQVHTVWYTGSVLDPMVLVGRKLTRSLARRILHPVDLSWPHCQQVRLVGSMLTRHGGPASKQDPRYLENLNYLLELKGSELRCVEVHIGRTDMYAEALTFTFDHPTLAWLVST